MRLEEAIQNSAAKMATQTYAGENYVSDGETVHKMGSLNCSDRPLSAVLDPDDWQPMRLPEILAKLQDMMAEFDEIIKKAEDASGESPCK